MPVNFKDAAASALARNGPKAEQILNRQTPLMPWGQQNNTAMQPRMTPAGSMTPLGSRALGGPTMMPSAGSGVSYGGFQNGANPEERIFGASGAGREIALAKQPSLYGPVDGGQRPVDGGQKPLAPMVTDFDSRGNPVSRPAQQPALNPQPLPTWANAKPPPAQKPLGFGGATGIAGARAEGGPVQAGRPYLVGERGPEVVVPMQNATVVPNQALAQFSPNAQALLRQPPGMRKTDWKRSLAAGGGIALMQMDREDARMQQRFAREDQLYMQQRNDQLADREAMKADREAMDRDEDARSMEMIQALGSDQAILSPADVATLRNIKGAKARSAALDVLMQRRAAEREEAKANEVPKPWAVDSGIPGVKIYGVGRSAMGSTEPQKTQVAPSDLLKQLGEGFEIVGFNSDGSYSIRQKQTPRPPTLKGVKNDLTGEMTWYDPTTGQQVIPGAATMPASPGASVGPGVPTAQAQQQGVRTTKSGVTWKVKE